MIFSQVSLTIYSFGREIEQNLKSIKCLSKNHIFKQVFPMQIVCKSLNNISVDVVYTVYKRYRHNSLQWYISICRLFCATQNKSKMFL